MLHINNDDVCARSSVVGTIYPVYASLKAVEAPLAQHPRRDAQWLTYWAIYGTFSLLEHHASGLLNWWVVSVEYHVMSCVCSDLKFWHSIVAGTSIVWRCDGCVPAMQVPLVVAYQIRFLALAAAPNVPGGCRTRLRASLRALSVGAALGFGHPCGPKRLLNVMATC